MTNELYHHGILGQKWGVRRYQNEDGSLTQRGLERYRKKDAKWIKKNNDRLIRKVSSKVSRDIGKYAKTLSKQPGYLDSRGKISKSTINRYNKKLASLMNEKVGDIHAPSGRVVRFVAKRGEVGVYTALADKGYDMTKVRNGVWSGGRVAYKSNSLNTIDI